MKTINFWWLMGQNYYSKRSERDCSCNFHAKGQQNGNALIRLLLESFRWRSQWPVRTIRIDNRGTQDWARSGAATLSSLSLSLLDAALMSRLQRTQCHLTYPQNQRAAVGRGGANAKTLLPRQNPNWFALTRVVVVRRRCLRQTRHQLS